MGTIFSVFMVHIDLTVLLVTCIDKLNVVLPFRNLKNIYVVNFCFVNNFLSIFTKQFFPFQKFPIPPFFGISPYSKKFFVSLSLCSFLGSPPPP